MRAVSASTSGAVGAVGAFGGVSVTALRTDSLAAACWAGLPRDQLVTGVAFGANLAFLVLVGLVCVVVDGAVAVVVLAGAIPVGATAGVALAVAVGVLGVVAGCAAGVLGAVAGVAAATGAVVAVLVALAWVAVGCAAVVAATGAVVAVLVALAWGAVGCAAVVAGTGLPPVLASATFVSVLAGVVPAVAGCAVPGVVAVVGVAVPSAGFRATARSVSGSVPLASSKGSTPRKPMPAASRDFFHCSSGMVDTPLPLDACVISSSPVFGLRTACTMWSMPP